MVQAKHKDSRTSTARTRSEHTQREDETRRQTPREYAAVTTNKCQVPRRAKCQGEPSAKAPDRSATTRRKHTGISGGPTRTPRTHEDSHDSPDTCAKCQGVPSARACQVPRRRAGKCKGSRARVQRPLGNGVGMGCGRGRTRAAVSERTWAATRRRGHQETAASSMAGAGKP